jgi:hypothetical protein
MQLIETTDVDEPFVKKRVWICCGESWEKQLKLFNPLDVDSIEEWAFTPVCPSCGGFDGSLFV